MTNLIYRQLFPIFALNTNIYLIAFRFYTPNVNYSMCKHLSSYPRYPMKTTEINETVLYIYMN